MKTHTGAMLTETIAACSIAFITIAAVASVLYTAAAVVGDSNDNLIMERVKEKVLADLAAGSNVSDISVSGSGCEIGPVRSEGGTIILRIFRDGFTGRKESLVIWPAAQ